VQVAAALQERRLLQGVADLAISLVLGVALASLGWWLTT
jgi:fluoride ion exporter CrcB/FEX